MNFLTSIATEAVNTATDAANTTTEALGMDGVMNALPYMGYGMVGIFLVTGIIILTVSILNKVTSKKEK